MNNKSVSTKNIDRLEFIKREYTDSFIPVSFKELAKMLDMNTNTLNDYMYRFSLFKSKEETSKNSKKYHLLLLYLNQNGFTLNELSDITGINYYVLSSTFTKLKKEEK